MRKLLLWCVILMVSISAGSQTALAQEDERTPIPIDDLIARFKAGEVEFQGLRVQCNDGNIFNLRQLVEPDTTEVAIPIKIVNSVIECPLTGRNLSFKSDVNFTGTTFEAHVNLAGSTFEEPLNMDNATFMSGITLGETTFRDPVSFNNASFFSSNPSPFVGFQLNGTTFWEGANFSGLVVDSPALIHMATFRGVATFEGATFKNTDAIFMDSTFEEKANFSHAVFEQAARFEDIDFEGDVLFKDTTFKENLSFRGSTVVGGEIDITGITIADRELDLFDLEYERLVAHDFDFDWVARSAGEFSAAYAIEVFAKLEANFRQQGRPTLANEAFYFKRDTECSLDGKGPSHQLECTLGNSVGYLVRLLEIVYFAVASFIVAGVANLIVRARPETEDHRTVELQVPTSPQQSQGVAITAREISAPGSEDDSPTGPGAILDQARQSFDLAFAAFISLRRSGVRSESGWNLPGTDALAALFVTIEWLVGYFVLFALGASLANTVPTLGELWTAVRF